MRRKILTLYLEELLILENGRQGNADAENIVLTSLIWPRPMIDLRTAAKPVRIEDGQRIQFGAAPFHEKILFKEIVGGVLGVTLEITERKSPGAIAEFIASIAADVFRAAVPLPPASETFRKIAHAGAVGLANRYRAAGRDTIVRIAFGHATIDPQNAGSGRIELPLVVPETMAHASSARRSRTPLLTKGQPNGQAILKYAVEED